jgi:hypothetical protein
VGALALEGTLTGSITRFCLRWQSPKAPCPAATMVSVRSNSRSVSLTKAGAPKVNRTLLATRVQPMTSSIFPPRAAASVWSVL